MFATDKQAQERYKQELEKFVLSNLSDFYEGVSPFYMSEAGHTDSLQYFRDHFPRFQEMISICDPHINQPLRMCEIGSFYPYVTFYWEGQITLYDLMPTICPTAKPYQVGRVALQNFNACTDVFPSEKYDLITSLEVLEHLPCNLFEVEKKVQDILAPGGLLLVTYPAHYNVHPYGYEEEMGDPSILHGGHLREFTEETVPLFFQKLTIVDQKTFSYPAYGKIIMVLYRGKH